jgi:predicted metal-dependent hydrolase
VKSSDSRREWDSPPGKPIPELPQVDRLVRSRRKTLALVVEQDGSLTVRAPLRLSLRAIQVFVERHQAWINAQRQRWVQLHKANPPKTYRQGEPFHYLGEVYPLLRLDAEGKGISFDGRAFYLPADHPDPAGAFERWYRQAARLHLEQRVVYFAGLFGFGYQKVRISGARRRWGSCSQSGSLNFAWRLVQAPPDVIDYVVLHELVHLEIPNHSKAFWQRLGEVCPEYAGLRAWLKQNGASLVNLKL